MNTRLIALFLFFWVSHLSPSDPVVVSRIPRERVKSEGIRAIGYSNRRHILEIEFVNGCVYRYMEVAPSVHRELMTAASKARYFDRDIKGNYLSLKVRSGTKP